MSLPVCQCGEEMAVGHTCQFRRSPQPPAQPLLLTEDDFDRLAPNRCQDPTFAGIPVQAPELLGIPAADTYEESLELEGAAPFSDDDWETIVHGSRQPASRPV